MTDKKVDFYQLGNKLWNIANIFRDDTLKTTEYLEEFSYFLFLKLFDDQERKREKLAELDGQKYIPYLPEELRFYNWATKIINNEIDITQAVSTVKEVFQKLATIKDHDDKDLWLFRKLFQNHIWRIKYGPTIRELLKKLIDLELEENFDVMGRAYEFVVQKLGEQKQYGQYFTPRHIIHFMVELADPEIGETIYDPAAGTGGFILRAFEVVKEKIDKQTQVSSNVLREPTANYGNISLDKAEKLLNDLKEMHLYGVEKAPDVYKLAMMNMILHNDGKSNLKEADSLDNRAQQEYKERFNVVLSNPPYGPLTQSRTATFIYHVKRFEALFIQHIMNALRFSEPNKKPNRAVVIILDKILFDSTKAFKGIRQKLLREYNLKAIFSMPAGIFQPYSGVKTTVLYFEKPTKEEWKKSKENNEYTTKEVLFFDIKSDGFTLSTQRRPINGAFQGDEPNIYEPPCGDLPKAVRVFKEWLKALDTENIDEFKEKYVDNEQVWIADIEEIKEKDFNLNPGLYRKVERGKVKWEWVRLGEICKPKMGKNLPQSKFITDGFDVWGANGIIGKYSDYLYENSEVTITCRGATCGEVNLTTPKSWITNNAIILENLEEEKTSKKFLYFLLKNMDLTKLITGSGQPQITVNNLCNLEIPLPPLEIQQKIVERLNKQQTIIEKAKEMEKAILDAGIDDAIFEGDWEWAELGEVANIFGGKRLPKGTKVIDNNTGIRYIRVVDLDSFGFFNIKNIKFITKEIYQKLRRYYVNSQDILITIVGATVGKVGIIPPELNGAIFTENFAKITIVNTQKIIPKYLFAYLMSKSSKKQINNLLSKGGQEKLGLYKVKSLRVPIPPLEKQQEIVEFLDAQLETLGKIRKMRENAEKMIKIILEKEVFGNGR